MSKILTFGLITATAISLVCGYVYAEGKEDNDMKTLKIKWQRLVSKEQTCPRCGSTEQELEKAVSTLKQSMAPLGIKVVVEKEEISLAAFQKDPSQSNRIWINDRPLEEWVNAEAGKSLCCDVCGDAECRTVVVGKQTYESIPADLIIKAGLAAASHLSENNKSCNTGKASDKKSASGCCSRPCM